MPIVKQKSVIKVEKTPYFEVKYGVLVEISGIEPLTS